MTHSHKTRPAGVAAILFAGAFLAACGGGGGGGSSPPSGGTGTSPPPPPPPANTAPVARAEVSPAAPKEGQPFVLDASGSTDPENNALSYTWSQLSGPAVTLPASNQARLELTAAEVTEDTEAVFRVAVSDGTNTSTTDVSVTFANIAQTPAVALPFPHAVTATFADRPILWSTLPNYGAILGTEETEGGRISLLRINASLSGNTLTVTSRDAIEETFVPPLQLSSHFASLYSSYQLGVLQENENRFRLYADPQFLQNPLQLIYELPLNEPCAIGPSSEGANPKFIFGLRNGGFGLYQLSEGTFPSIETSASWNGGGLETHCGVLATPRSSSGGSFSDSNSRVLPEIIAVNAKTNSIEHYTQTPLNIPQPEQAQYALSAVTPVMLNSSEPLDFIKAVPVFSPFNHPSLALLYSNGEHDGEHRLIIVGIDDDRRITQVQHRWSIGVPDNLVQLNITDSFGLEVVILSSTSPQAVVFESTDDNGSLASLGEPSFMEVGLGATTAASVPYQWYEDDGIVILYPDKKEAKVFAPFGQPSN